MLTDSELKPNKGVHAQQVASDWMRAVLQKEIAPDVLHRVVGDVPDFLTLLHRLYEGRLSDRNRSMVVLANRYGLSSRTVCAFLSISRNTHRTYLRMFKIGGQTCLFARQTNFKHKSNNE